MLLLTVERVHAPRALSLDLHRLRAETVLYIDVEFCCAICTLFVSIVNVLRSTRAVPDAMQI